MKKLFLLFVLLLSLSLGCADENRSAATPGPSSESPVASYPSPAAAPSPSVSAAPATPTEDPGVIAERERQRLLQAAAELLGFVVDEDFPVHDFLLWLEESLYPGVLAELSDMPDDTMEIKKRLRERTGETLAVLKDRWNGLLDSPETARAANIYLAEASDPDKTIIAFTGDILYEEWYVIHVYRAVGKGLPGVLTGGLLDAMRAADVLLINNEFPFTERGRATPNKRYTFRAAPELVRLHIEMGADAAFLANNHVYDYGPDGLSDTLKTLDEAGIARTGAGMNAREASKPLYFIVNGRKFAFINASCIERYSRFTPGATDDSPGTFRADIDNTELLLAVIQEAVENSDFVTTVFHWGVENTTKVEPYQRELAQLAIDAGADAVIGGHPHILQGAEFYNGKPIIYSLGNFWFSRAKRDTVLLQLILDADGNPSLRMLPCLTQDGITKLASGDLATRILRDYAAISFGVVIDADGYLYDERS